MRRLLVANRGEIAVRIMTTAATLKIPTVAICPEDDEACGHVAKADAHVRIPGAGPAAYLNITAIVTAAKQSDCDALHPGYGFLSESAALARRCADESIRFVGPSPAALGLLGDKPAVLARARQLGIPVLASSQGPADLQAALEFRSSLGPGAVIMVKAVAGGGGRGIRAVAAGGDLAEAIERCASEARAAFGDGAVYVEEFLPRARHVEVQILGDGHGGVVSLGDRDCSIQRRRQKLIEIAPAPWVSEPVRQALHDCAIRLIASVQYAGVATVEFLVADADFAFLEVNPRLQVEHTVTEEVTGLDLVELGLRIAGGERLTDLGAEATPRPRGVAIQARVNSETMEPDGTVRPAAGTLLRFQPPPGRGVRVDTHGYVGYTINPRYDSLLAKLIVTEASGTFARGAARTIRALAEFEIRGIDTNIPLLQALLADPRLVSGEADTEFVDRHLPELLAAAPARPTAPDPACGDRVSAAGQAPTTPGVTTVIAPLQGVVVEILATTGTPVAAGTALVVIEAMKMEHVLHAEQSGFIDEVAVEVGDVVAAGSALLYVRAASIDDAGPADEGKHDPDALRPDLAEVIARHQIGLDEGRPVAVASRHAAGRRTARENILDLCDPGSFVEYGALVIAAQRSRRPVADLIQRTPADGLVAGTATIDGRAAAVMSYDYTVLAGTQGRQNHRKTDRLLDIAGNRQLPVVIFAEGGGGRPGDDDGDGIVSLDSPTFRKAAELAGKVPLVAVVSGYCFAGNAALAGTCDVIIATEGSSLGMGGPAMIEGGGLGKVAPHDVGPMHVQVRNGVVDVLVADEGAAVRAARRYLSYFSGRVLQGEASDQRLLRQLVPENRVRAYDVRPVIAALADVDSVFELRAGFGTGIVTALIRLGGRNVGVIANNPSHLGGAIDADAADKAARFLGLCETYRLPVLSLCDTPGFMVGPDAERSAAVRRFSAMFVAGARLTVPLCMVVLRKCYGLGAMAMGGGELKKPLITLSWPTGEVGGMGLEGAVRLGYRRELEAISDCEQRERRYEELVAEQYERGKALTVATAYGIDDVVDPADTRSLLVRTLNAAHGTSAE